METEAAEVSAPSATAGIEGGAVRYVVGALEIDVERRRAVLAGWRLRLTGMQFQLLAYLARHEGRVVSRAVLLRDVWGYAAASTTRTIDVHVQRIRARLGRHAPLLTTVRGVGYRLAREAEQAD